MMTYIDEEALSEDGADLPPPGTRYHEVEAWLSRRLGRQPTR